MTEIPGAARIEQFAADIDYRSSITCKACGERLNHPINTGRSDLLEILEAIALHQCKPDDVLRHQMALLVRELRSDGDHATADKIQQRLWDTDPRQPIEDAP